MSRNVAAVLGLAALLLAPRLLAQEFSLYVEDTGVYRVTHEELVVAGLMPEPVASSGIGLESFGVPVAVWIEDGGDGSFGPGDRIEFVGQELRGEYTYLDEYSRFNCYKLRFDHQAPARFQVLDPTPGSDSGEEPRLWVQRHLEQDLLMLRYRQRGETPEESWYWAKLTHLDKRPLKIDLELDDLDRQSDQPVGVKIGFRAWSEPRLAGRAPEHRVELLVNGQPFGSEEWDGQQHHVVELEVPVVEMTRGVNRVAMRIPRRQRPGGDHPIIDVIMLNWVEISYPARPTIGDAQVRFSVSQDSEGLPVRLATTTDGPIKVYGVTGKGLVAPVARRGVLRFQPPAGEPELFLSTAEALLDVDELVIDQPSSLMARDRQADYIMIGHRSLLEAVEPLAEFHRQRGLAVAVVDVQDVYDEFNGGVLHPRAIRDFIRHAVHEWQEPAARFVLLVGDASWDFKNPTTEDSHYADWTYRPGEARRFVKNRSTPYAENTNVNDRNLVPTWEYPTSEGHAAADTWFACIDGDDHTPDLAIGRLPVVDPEDVAAVVRKTIAYVNDPEVGPWRRSLLFITNENQGFQRRSDVLASSFLERGYAPIKIYPQSDQLNDQHTQRIVEVLDAGVNFIHFIGHGGRYIWRTGPPDLKKNHDLFGLDHLEQLVQTRRLPIVLSLTCYSAPFDHPSADSIGEKFLRVADRGAIAVVAASWRNSPSPAMGRFMMEELTEAGATVGEAVMRAKQQLNSPSLIQTYNLLGDPAVPVALPGVQPDLEVEQLDGHLIVRGSGRDRAAPSRALIELVDSNLATVAQQELEVAPSGFELSLPLPELEEGVELLGVRAYLWQPAAAWDAIGWSALASDSDQDDSGDEAVETAAGPAPSTQEVAGHGDPSQPQEMKESGTS